jgi:pyrimidine-specific ribonucleoside hydrolase
MTHNIGAFDKKVRFILGLVVIALGPLTNLAVALDLDPELAERLTGIVLMGGSLTGGNITPAAEFNIWADPEAARAVFTSGVPIRMVGLNLTEQARVGPDEVARMRALGNRVGRACADLMDFYRGRVEELVGIDSAALHDPCAVAWLIDPTLITSRPMHVDVELAGELTRGMTVCDARPQDGGRYGESARPLRGAPPANAEVALELDVVRFFDLLLDTLAGYP